MHSYVISECWSITYYECGSCALTVDDVANTLQGHLLKGFLKLSTDRVVTEQLSV